MSFMQSDPKMYRPDVMQYDGVIEKWKREDWYSILAPLFNDGYRWSGEKMKLMQMGPSTINAETPWCHCKHSPGKLCNLDHHLLFKYWNIITPRCLECWKVVVSPRTFIELLKLEQLERQLDLSSKCGIELRDYTPRFYGGYFYNDSLEEGRECYKIVRSAVDEAISPDVDVILKRACTEFEMKNGASPFWKTTKEQLELIQGVEHFVDIQRYDHDQPSVFKRAIRLKWAIWAHMNGDMSYTELNGGHELWPKCVTYHEGELDDIKHDILISRATAKSDIPAEKTEAFLKNSLDWATENDVDPNTLVDMLGLNEYLPFKINQSLLKDIPDEKKGEDADIA